MDIQLCNNGFPKHDMFASVPVSQCDRMTQPEIGDAFAEFFQWTNNDPMSDQTVLRLKNKTKNV